MHVLATAGHVDHGKSTLVRLLTGMEPDRWAEERRRGMTIDLGFAWTPIDTPWLPPDEQVAFVDVPGHERFLKNMLAGVGSTPAVLFVVAADDGWMPQSQEHLDVLDALGVQHGLLVITRCDLATDDQRVAARATAAQHFKNTTLSDLPVIEVSATTGAGITGLQRAIADLTTDLPAPDPLADVRFWVDRTFTVAGAGTVVTGTLAAGTLRVGDDLEIDGRRVQVRALQVLGRHTDLSGPVARVAVNLRGADVTTVARGSALLTPHRWLAAGLIDVRTSTDPHDLPRRMTLHTGSAAVPTTVRPLGPDTARLTLDTALPLRHGDRVLLRDAGAHHVVGGTVLDIRPPALSRRGAAAARAAALATVGRQPDLAGELRRRGIASAATLTAAGVDTRGQEAVHGWLVDPPLWAQLSARLTAIVTDHATAGRLTAGPTSEDVRRQLGLPDRRLVDAVVAGTDGVTLRDGMVQPAQGADDVARLPPDVRQAVDAVTRQLTDAPFRAPEADELRRLGLGPAQVKAAVRAGLLVEVAEGIVLLPRADDRAAELLATLDQPFTTSQARQALDTTRRVAIPLLEHLDRTGRTERVDHQQRKITAVHDGDSAGG